METSHEKDILLKGIENPGVLHEKRQKAHDDDHVCTCNGKCGDNCLCAQNKTRL